MKFPSVARAALSGSGWRMWASSTGAHVASSRLVAGSTVIASSKESRDGMTASSSGRAILPRGSLLCDVRSYLSEAVESNRVAELVCTDTTVRLRPLFGGFDITIGISGPDQLYLFLGGWMEDEYNISQIIGTAKLALAGEIRVRETRLNDRPWTIAIESRMSDGTWQEISQVSYVRFSIWRRRITTRLSQYPASH